jgi:hypothetical protein
MVCFFFGFFMNWFVLQIKQKMNQFRFTIIQFLVVTNQFVEVLAPSFWDQLMKTFEKQGMTTANRWWVCNGINGEALTPQLLRPSVEDLYNGLDTLKCGCKFGMKLQQNCATCCEKCVVCGKHRRDTLVFDYFPFTSLFTNMCMSHTYCHEFLEL